MSKDRIKFILKHPQGEKETLIYLIYRDGFRFKYSIREKVLPANWSFDRQRMKEIRGLPHRNFNAHLDLIARNFEEIVLILKREKRYTMSNLATEMDFLMNRRTIEPITDYLQKYVDSQHEAGRYAQSKSFGTLRNKLLQFADETGTHISYSEINEEFANRFRNWLLSKTRTVNEIKIHYSLNYAGKMLANLRRVMTYAEADGMHRNREYKDITGAREDVYKVYLTTDELRKLIDAELPPYLANARDIFVVGCYTGLRVGNYLKIDPDAHIDLDTGFITAIANKNGPRLKIPIHPQVQKIIEKYGGMPHSISEQKLRIYIKESSKRAGINQVVVWKRTEGGRVVEHRNPKYELVSTHTARRTFATNAYKAGITAYDIMQITGHTTESSFLKYIRITQEEAAERIKAHSFFSA